MNGKIIPPAGSPQKNIAEPAEGKPTRKVSCWPRILRWTAIAGGVCIGLLIFSFLAVQFWPVIGAQGADVLRSIIGDQAVAGLEMKVNQVQDELQKLKYQLGLDRPVAPWVTAQIPLQSLTPTALSTATTSSTPQPQTPETFLPTTTPEVNNTPQPTLLPTPSVWQPVNLTPLGSAAGEGVWSAFFQDAEGHTVAYRTFVQPDPTRPYTLVAIVAIDLNSYTPAFCARLA